MKKLLLVCLLLTGWSQAQNIQFEDAELKKVLLSTDTNKFIAKDVNNQKVNLDNDNNGEISILEIDKVSKIKLNDSLGNVQSINDLQKITNLIEIDLRNLNVQNFDFTNNKSLSILKLSGCKHIYSFKLVDNLFLESVEFQYCSFYNQIDVKGCVNLNSFTMMNGSNYPYILQLDSFKKLEAVAVHAMNVNGITLPNSLIYLYVGFCDSIKEIDFSSTPNLEYLDLNFLPLKDLNLSLCPKLKQINLDLDLNINIGLNTIDLSQNLELINLSLQGKNIKIKSLDLSSNIKLKKLKLMLIESLERVYIKNGVSKPFLTFGLLPNLKYICTDEDELEYVAKNYNWSDAAIKNVEINSFCTFEPKGDINTISGRILLNSNLSECDTNNLIVNSKIKLNIEDSINGNNYITNKTGNFSIPVYHGSFNLSLNIENSSLFSISPSNANITFLNSLKRDTTINFCITPNGIHNDLEIVLSPIGPARPGFESKYQVTYKNKGNQILSGDFKVEYNDDVLDLVASSLNSVSTGKLGKSFVDLKPFEISASDTIVFKVNSPIEVPAVNIGDTLKFITTINPLQGDEKPEDNVAKFNQIVVGAYDPNIITCLQGNVLPSKEIGKTLHYTIDFENTGNYPAENIVVVETIDPKKYDINSIQILNTSHPMKLRIEGNKVEYYFQNIDLGEHKHGNILLKLRALSNLIEGDTVNKQANIYFDYNAPVETNKETTVYKDQLLASIKGITLDESIIAYPNPNNGLFTLKAANQISSVEIYDLHGRSIQTIIVNDFTNKIDLSKQDAGIYLLKVTTSTGANVIEIKKD